MLITSPDNPTGLSQTPDRQAELVSRWFLAKVFVGMGVVALALAKARAIARALPDPGSVVLGADTEVVLDGELLGKPRDGADAARILRRLRGRVHEVITGLALVEVGPRGRQETAAVTTRVRMADAADEEIEAYVATGEPFDKAGAYAVQGLGGRLVAEVDGCFTNVVGLPVETTRRLLQTWGMLR